jgi:hypothetical protein
VESAEVVETQQQLSYEGEAIEPAEGVEPDETQQQQSDEGEAIEPAEPAEAVEPDETQQQPSDEGEAVETQQQQFVEGVTDLDSFVDADENQAPVEQTEFDFDAPNLGDQTEGDSNPFRMLSDATDSFIQNLRV